MKNYGDQGGCYPSRPDNTTMWFIGVEVQQETSAPRPKKNPGSAPEILSLIH